MSGETFTASRYAWLSQVKVDPDLPASAFKVAFEISEHANRAEFESSGKLVAWPSLVSIADGIGMSERTAREMVRRLAKRHLDVVTGHGPGHSSRYTLTHENRQEPAALNRQPASALNRQEPAAFEGKPAGCDMKTGSSLPDKTGSRLPPKLLTQTSEETSDKNNRRNQSNADVLAELATVLDEEHAQAVIEHRRKLGKKCALTPYAARQLAKQFALCPDPNDAADEMILRGWRGFKADWINSATKQSRHNSRSLAAGALAAGFDDDGG